MPDFKNDLDVFLMESEKARNSVDAYNRGLVTFGELLKMLGWAYIEQLTGRPYNGEK